MQLRQLLTAVVAVAALVCAPALAGTAAAAPAASSKSAGTQSTVKEYLAVYPGSRQVSANKLLIPGGSLTLATAGVVSPALACGSGHLCIKDGNGNTYDYYYCGYYSFYGLGNGTFNNNQTSGTVAKFYNSDGSLRWTNTAKYSGTASWTPVFYIRPC